MSSALTKYRELEQRLFAVRRKNSGAESQEEDDILDEMDPVWWNLTEEERDMLNKESEK